LPDPPPVDDRMDPLIALDLALMECRQCLIDLQKLRSR
jgi:hypothetical protein